MFKFAPKEDCGYRIISGYLGIMAQDAGAIVNSRWGAESRINAVLTDAEEAFSVSFSLPEVSETEHVVAIQKELVEIHKELNDNGSGRTVIPYGLGGIGKTRFAIACTKRHVADYSALLSG